MPAGRPSKFTEELANVILTQVSEGIPTTKICQDVEIDVTTLFAWLDAKPEFSQKYARAKEIAMERMADEILEIADDGQNDTYIDSDGNERTDHDVIARSRLRVDTRKWLMSKLAPKKYSDKQQVEHTGQIDHSVTVNIRPKPVKNG